MSCSRMRISYRSIKNEEFWIKKDGFCRKECGGPGRLLAYRFSCTNVVAPADDSKGRLNVQSPLDGSY